MADRRGCSFGLGRSVAQERVSVGPGALIRGINWH